MSLAVLINRLLLLMRHDPSIRHMKMDYSLVFVCICANAYIRLQRNIYMK